LLFLVKTVYSPPPLAGVLDPTVCQRLNTKMARVRSTARVAREGDEARTS
jgi:hypothetical protein